MFRVRVPRRDLIADGPIPAAALARPSPFTLVRRRAAARNARRRDG